MRTGLNLFEQRCPSCGRFSEVRLVWSFADRARLVANVVMALLAGGPLLALTRKCVGCGIYFRGHKTWTRPGECISCGYNLTGNTSGVCPECGKSSTTDSQV